MQVVICRAMSASRFALLAGCLGAVSSLPAAAQMVDTRIGPLTFETGYPSAETASALYDELDFQRATQAYLWALPAVGFAGLHQAHLNIFGAADGDIVLYDSLADKAGMLTPNITTVYAFSFWDLGANGPVVIEVPPGLTAGGILDIWQRPMSDVGQTGPDQGNGGKYLILPPGVEEIDAPGYIIVRSPTNQLWFGTRGLDPDPLVARETLVQHRIYAWADRDAPPEQEILSIDGKAWTSQQPNTIEYWQILSDLFRNEPIEDRDRMMFAMLRPLGVIPGEEFAPDERQAAILTQAAVLGDLMARTIAYDKRFDNSTVYPDKQWEYANLLELDQEADGYTQLDERTSWFYEAVANSSGMQGRILGFGQVYLEASKDAAGNWLDGGQSYVMHVDPNPPVKQFWSITLYDNLIRGPVVTDAGSADLSSRSPDLVTNDDGSVDVYFGPTRPDGADNWIKTTEGQGWFAYFRFYGPLEGYFDQSWQLNDITLLAE